MLLALALGLGACAVPVPEFTPPPTEATAYPVMDESQLQRVLAGVNETLQEADAAESRAELTDRITGLAERMRGWEYALARATEEADLDEPYTPQPLGTDPAVAAVAATSEWPRWVMVITDPPEGGNLPLLLALTQEGPRDLYSLAGWVRLLPGVTTPQMHAPASGSAQLGPQAEGLVLSPEAAVEAYAELLSGEETEEGEAFAEEDPYREILDAEFEALSDSLEVAGRVRQVTTPVGSALALETFDGGAIVFGGLKTVHTYEKTVSGAKMMVGDQVSALNDGQAEVDSELTAEYRHMVAFYIPPEGSEEPVNVLGAERVLRDVKEPEE